MYGAAPGRNVTLTCDICINPDGDITWSFKDSPLRENISVSNDGRNITLSPVLLEDFGNYSCHVNNTIFGEEYSKTFLIELYEQGAPHTPSGFTIIGSTSFSINVSWVPGRDGGFKQYFHLSYRINKTGAWHLWKADIPDCNCQIEESITDLESNTLYEFELYSKNENDDESVSESERIQIETSTKGEFK